MPLGSPYARAYMGLPTPPWRESFAYMACVCATAGFCRETVPQDEPAYSAYIVEPVSGLDSAAPRPMSPTVTNM